MNRDYSNQTMQALVHNFCCRVPDLYMDMLGMARGLGRDQLIMVLQHMDLDDDDGGRGRLRRRPFTDDPGGTGTSGIF